MNPLDEWAAAELAATMRPCRELPREERDAKREADAVAAALMFSTAVDNAPETVEKRAS